jgi:FkbM family methyltransferase
VLKKLLDVIIRYARRVKIILDKKRNRKLLLALSKLPYSGGGITLIDIGAAGDIEPRWKRIEPALCYIGFEPDERSRLSLLKSKPACLSYELFPFAVWDVAGPLEMNFCQKPQVSSHYLPNRPFVDLFPDSQRFNVLSTQNMEATTLDNLKLGRSDFIKIDTQGGELNALKGGQALLKKTLGLEVEVEFSPMYIDQPLFGEVCSLLRNSGFEFIDFTNLCRWERLSHNGYGQCIFGDALFLRSPENLIRNNFDNESISKYLGICLIYDRFDMIDRVINLLPETQSSSQADFLKAIEPMRRSNRIARIIVRVISLLFRLLWSKYRPHLIY